MLRCHRYFNHIPMLITADHFRICRLIFEHFLILSGVYNTIFEKSIIFVLFCLFYSVFLQKYIITCHKIVTYYNHDTYDVNRYFMEWP